MKEKDTARKADRIPERLKDFAAIHRLDINLLYLFYQYSANGEIETLLEICSGNSRLIALIANNESGNALITTDGLQNFVDHYLQENLNHFNTIIMKDGIIDLLISYNNYPTNYIIEKLGNFFRHSLDNNINNFNTIMDSGIMNLLHNIGREGEPLISFDDLGNLFVTVGKDINIYNTIINTNGLIFFLGHNEDDQVIITINNLTQLYLAVLEHGELAHLSNILENFLEAVELRNENDLEVDEIINYYKENKLHLLFLSYDIAKLAISCKSL